MQGDLEDLAEQDEYPDDYDAEETGLEGQVLLLTVLKGREKRSYKARTLLVEGELKSFGSMDSAITRVNGLGDVKRGKRRLLRNGEDQANDGRGGGRASPRCSGRTRSARTI